MLALPFRIDDRAARRQGGVGQGASAAVSGSRLPSLGDAYEAIGAPPVAAYAVVDEEQTPGIVLPFPGSQPRVVRSPGGPSGA